MCNYRLWRAQRSEKKSSVCVEWIGLGAVGIREACAIYCISIIPQESYSVQFSSSVMSNSLGLHELQLARPPCPSPTLGIHPNPCLLSWWCHPTISSSIIPFSSCSQSFPASESFQMSQLFTSGGQSIGVSASATVLPNEYLGLISFRVDWLDLLAVQETLKSLQHHSSKASILCCSAFFTVQLSHSYMTTGKTMALTRRTFVSWVMSLLFNMLSRFVIAFLPRSKHLLISWLQSPSAVILEPKNIKSLTVFIVSCLFAMKWWDRMSWF